MTPIEAFEKAMKALEEARLHYEDKIESINTLHSSYENIKTMLAIVCSDRELLEMKLDDTQKQLNEALNGMVASIAPFSTPTPPEGWLECNGQIVNREEYSRLFEKIGITFGAGDSVTTFQLPDLRGQFVRGWDPSGEIDGERELGSLQSDQIQTHRHRDEGHTHVSQPHNHSVIVSVESASYRLYSKTIDRGNSDSTVDILYYDDGKNNNTDSSVWWIPWLWGSKTKRLLSHSHKASTEKVPTTINTANASISAPTEATHGSETRPRNIALLYCIKY